MNEVRKIIIFIIKCYFFISIVYVEIIGKKLIEINQFNQNVCYNYYFYLKYMFECIVNQEEMFMQRCWGDF